jgi:hypothetical protein
MLGRFQAIKCFTSPKTSRFFARQRLFCHYFLYCAHLVGAEPANMALSFTERLMQKFTYVSLVSLVLCRNFTITGSTSRKGKTILEKSA